MFVALTLIVAEVSPPVGTTMVELLDVTVIVEVLDVGAIIIGSEAVGLDGVLCVIIASVMLTVSEKDLMN